MGSFARYFASFFILQVIFLGCKADDIGRAASAQQYNDAVTKVAETFEKYSEFSLRSKISEVSKGLPLVANALHALTGPAGAVIAFIQIGVGTIAGQRHEEVMNAFKVVNQKFDVIKGKIDAQTTRLESVMREIDYSRYVAPIKTSILYYNSYLEHNGEAGYGRDLASNLAATETSIIGLKRSIGPFFRSQTDHHPDFEKLFDLQTEVSLMLSQAKLALSVACVERCRTRLCKTKCQNRPSFTAMTTIVKKMKNELKRAKSFAFAKDWAKKWIMRNIEEGGHHSARDEIGEMLDTHFKHFKYALAVTPELSGGDNHWSNFDIRIFRRFGKNIYLTFKPLNYVKQCYGGEQEGYHEDAHTLFNDIRARQGSDREVTVHRTSYAWWRHTSIACEIQYYKLLRIEQEYPGVDGEMIHYSETIRGGHEFSAILI